MFNWRMLIVFAMGIASGLPLLLVGSTLKAWCTEAGLSLTTIGFFGAISVAYSLKFFMAPLFDFLIPPFLGRRRGWLFITQAGVVLSLAALSMFEPRLSTAMFAATAFSIAIFAAAQDIIIDAYRIEILHPSEFGLGNSLYIMGYRLAMAFAGYYALYLADFHPWPTVYLIMAASMATSLLTTLLGPEPQVEVTPKTWKEACIDPLLEFIRRPGVIWVLGFITLYKIGDVYASEMSMPFFLRIGFDKADIGAIAKIGGLLATIIGGFAGGIILMKIGMKKSLWLFGILQGISTMTLAVLAQVGPSIPVLWGVISFENLASGMGTAAYATYMASLVNKKYTATQYALLTSFMGLSRVFATPSGFLAEHLGWRTFFIMSGLGAIPGLLILLKLGNGMHLEDEAALPPPEAEASVS